MSQPLTPSAAVRTWRMLAGALTTAPLVVGIAMTFVLSSTSSTSRNGTTTAARPSGVSTTAIAIEAALAVAVALAVEVVGYRTRPLAPGSSEQQIVSQTLQRFQVAMFLRFAMCEAVAVVSIAVAFVVSTRSPLNYWVGGVLAVALLALHVWPNGRVVDRMTARLEADGVRSPLPELFNRSR